MNFKNIKIIETELFTRVIINRPEKLNALSTELFLELREFLTGLQTLSENSPKLLTLEGAGDRAFIAGADIKEMSQMTPAAGEAFAKLAQDVTELFEAVPMPVVACVDGHALGGGCEMALSCDFIFVTKKAILGQPEVNLGLIPGFGGCVRLARATSPSIAKRMIYTGMKLNAQKAKEVGLADEVFDSQSEMMNAVSELAETLKAKSPRAISLCKRVINGAANLEMNEALTLEREAFKEAFKTEDKHIGTKAFLAKAPAQFVGR